MQPVRNLSTILAAPTLLSSQAPDIERAQRSEEPKLAPSPSRRYRKASKGKKGRTWKGGTPPVVIFGMAAHDTLTHRGSKIGPKRRRRLMRAVGRLEAFHKRHKGAKSSAEILQSFKDEARRLVARGLLR